MIMKTLREDTGGDPDLLFAQGIRHIKRGTTYQIKAIIILPRPEQLDEVEIEVIPGTGLHATLQVSQPDQLPGPGASVSFCLYRADQDGKLWVRPLLEILDPNRFNKA